jgi:cobalamin biosynthesis protein CbiD
MCALADANGSTNEGITHNNGGAAISKNRREMLLEYVRNVQPEFLE